MELAADTQSHIVESIGGAMGVKCSASAKQMCWTADRRLGRLIQSSFGLEMLDNGVEAMANVVTSIGTVVILWYGAYSVIHQQLTVGQLMAFYSLVGMVLSPVERLIGLNRELQDAVVAADRLLEIMDLPTETDQGKSVLSDVSLAGDIHLDGVSFHFPGRLPLFENLTLCIPSGKTTAMIGPSGVGKSTICQMLNRLYAPDTGRVFIGDTDVSHVTLPTLRRKVGYVSTTPFIFSGTVRENIQLGQPETGFEAVIAAATIAQAHEFIEELPQGYDTVLSEGGSNLSTGQRLRIILARAILAKPQVLILDEVSSLLDPVTEARVLESLRGSLPGLTLILVTHRNTARHWIDNTIQIDHDPTAESKDDARLTGVVKAIQVCSGITQE
jgi:ATP-binding cassette subfamily B protein